MLRAAITVVLMAAASAVNAQYIVPDTSPPPYDYGGRIPGKWIFMIDTAALKKALKPIGTCSEQSFPIEIGDAFNLSAVEALRNTFYETEEVFFPITDAEVKSRKGIGLITVRGNDVSTRLFMDVGYFLSHAQAAATVSAQVSVTVKDVRVVDAPAEGKSTAEADVSGPCAAGAKMLTDVTTAAMRDAVKNIGDVLRRSEDLRKASLPPPAPPPPRARSRGRPR